MTPRLVPASLSMATQSPTAGRSLLNLARKSSLPESLVSPSPFSPQTPKCPFITLLTRAGTKSWRESLLKLHCKSVFQPNSSKVTLIPRMRAHVWRRSDISEWTGCGEVYCAMEADLPADMAGLAFIGASLEWQRASPRMELYRGR